MNKTFPQLEHELVGVLSGIDLDASISHGYVIASNSRRVAVATWDRIQLYAIEPDAFLTSKTGSLQFNESWPKKTVKRKSLHFSNYSCEFGRNGDHTYSTNCGQGFYRRYTRLYSRRLVSIKPIELPRRGVVHKLHFTDDDTLWAWTDGGLVKWYWGPGRKQKRQDAELFPGPVEFDGPVGYGKSVAPEEEDKMDWEP